MRVLYFWRNVTIMTSSLTIEKVEELLTKKDGHGLDALLRNASPLTDDEQALLRGALTFHCLTHKQLLPNGITPETLLSAGIPVVELSQNATSDKLKMFWEIEAIAKRSLDPVGRGLLYQLDTGMEEVLNKRNEGQGIVLTRSENSLFFNESSHDISLKRYERRIGNAGSLTLLWQACHTTFHGGWLHNVELQLVTHAGARPKGYVPDVLSTGSHIFATVTVQLEEGTGRVLAIQPTVPSDESYGLRLAACTCK